MVVDVYVAVVLGLRLVVAMAVVVAFVVGVVLAAALVVALGMAVAVVVFLQAVWVAAFIVAAGALWVMHVPWGEGGDPKALQRGGQITIHPRPKNHSKCTMTVCSDSVERVYSDSVGDSVRVYRNIVQCKGTVSGHSVQQECTVTMYNDSVQCIVTVYGNSAQRQRTATLNFQVGNMNTD